MRRWPDQWQCVKGETGCDELCMWLLLDMRTQTLPLSFTCLTIETRACRRRWRVTTDICIMSWQKPLWPLLGYDACCCFCLCFCFGINLNLKQTVKKRGQKVNSNQSDVWTFFLLMRIANKKLDWAKKKSEVVSGCRGCSSQTSFNKKCRANVVFKISDPLIA